MEHQKVKILYLEDDQFTRLIVQAQLESAGFSVESFSSYNYLVEAVNEKHHDLVITDLNIDDLTPKNFIIALKEISDVPIVVLSGKDQQVVGVDLTLIKPLTDEKIMQIKNLLGNNAPLDLSKLHQFACGDDDLMQSYIATFIDNHKRDMASLKTDIDECNITGIEHWSHKMLSSITYYGNQEINKLLRKMESDARFMSRNEFLILYYEIEEQSYRLMNALRRTLV